MSYYEILRKKKSYELSIPEILRGITKRKNQGEMSEEEAQKIMDSIHLSAKIVKEKMKTIDIRGKEALKNFDFYV